MVKPIEFGGINLSGSQGKLYRLGADIGGTFTDIVLLGEDGQYWTKKVSSTPKDYSVGIVGGTLQLLSELKLDGGQLQEVIHGTTVAINTILENKGAKTALITTKGFRDVLEFRRLRVPHLYSLLYEPPKPLVERRLRLEVDERVGSGGEVVTPLNEDSIMSAIERIKDSDAQSIAVCLLHSFSNPEHERRVGELIKEHLPGRFCTLSVDVLPEIREYERTSTTVVNAYLGPIVRGYVDSLVKQFDDSGVKSPVRIMQSNGGVMSAARASETPVQIIESGPAAGVVAAHEVGSRVGLKNLITFDMGGTTAKASLIEDGELNWTTEHEVGAGISLSSRLVKGGGHAVKVPVVDLAEVGAGGGSIVWIDRGGALKVGPQSAGASPGPVSYGFGGTEPTVTDANIVLGYINPDSIAGGEVKLKSDLGRTALSEKVANPLGMELLDSAYGVHTVANVTMIRAIRAVSTYRGRDPREFTLLAFGGSGPIHAVEIARSLGIGKVIIPPAPGVFSAVGLLVAQPEQHFVQTFFGKADGIDTTALNQLYKDMESEGLKTLTSEGYESKDITWRRTVDLRYVGQAYELSIQAPGKEITVDDVSELVNAFHNEHERTYGHMAVDEPVEIVNLRMTALGKSSSSIPVQSTSDTKSSVHTNRDVYFGPDHGLLKTPIVSRSDLSFELMSGPMIIEEYDATVVVFPDCHASLDKWGHIVIDVGIE